MEVSNADRVVYPDDGITKGEVVDHYELVAGLMMPFVGGRALTVERFPRGIGSKGFMQKNAPEHFGDEVIDRHEVPKEGGGTTIYPVVREEAAIAAFANLGVITFHAPPTTIDDERHPDWVIWDLDPPPGRSDLAREAAERLRDVLESFEISPLVMTSGSNGFHLRRPLDRRADFASVSHMARGISALAAAAEPDLLTLAFRKADRGDRVFVDWLRNAPYSTAVAPWSLRARAGAPVAVPISWDELGEVDPAGVRLHDVEGRIGGSPWEAAEALDATTIAARVESALDDANIELEPFDRFRS